MSDRIHDAFDSIKADDTLKTATKDFLKEVRERENAVTPESGHMHGCGRAGWMLAMVCTLLIFVCGIGGYTFLFSPSAYVSIDVNPSVELVLNRMDRVISAKAYNEDGEIILNQISVRGKLYTEAIDIIVESEAMTPYLTEDAALTFTVASGSKEKEAAMLTAIKNCSGCQGHGGQSYIGNMDMIETAHENGLSLGKYAAFLALSRYDETVTAKDCQDMTMSEIHSRINAHEDNENHGNQGNHGKSENQENQGNHEDSENHGNQENSSGSGKGGGESQSSQNNGHGRHSGNGSGRSEKDD